MARRYETDSDDNSTDPGLNILFNEADGVTPRHTGQSPSWPQSKTRMISKVYKNDRILGEILDTRVRLRDLLSQTETSLINRILELGPGTGRDEELDLRRQKRSETEDIGTECDFNSDEMPSEVDEGMCTRYGCLDAHTQTGECTRCGQEKHEYADYKGHFGHLCKSNKPTRPQQWFKGGKRSS